MRKLATSTTSSTVTTSPPPYIIAKELEGKSDSFNIPIIVLCCIIFGLGLFVLDKLESIEKAIKENTIAVRETMVINEVFNTNYVDNLDIRNPKGDIHIHETPVLPDDDIEEEP